MSNLTKKDRSNIRSGINRAFSRSELRQKVLDNAVVYNVDPLRPRVKTWCRCASCHKLEARSYMDVDHKSPKVPIHLTADDMSWETYIDACWCDISNLQALCEGCHSFKTKAENKLRRSKKK